MQLVNFLERRGANKTEVQGLSQFLFLYPKPDASYSRIIIRNVLYLKVSVIQSLFMLYQVMRTHDEKTFGFKIHKHYSKQVIHKKYSRSSTKSSYSAN